jgi:glycosyltransferase involved in cell wall biosynthesis
MKNKIKEDIKISVIINCLNGERYLKKCIKSVLSQTYQNLEIIFWDNQSNDKSASILKSFSDKRIKYYKSKLSTNLYSARNFAIKKAKGDFVSFLDVDDWWAKDKLTKQILLLKQNKNIKIIYSNLYIYDQNKKKFSLAIRSKMKSGMIASDLLKKYCVGLLTVLIERKIFDKNKFNDKYNIIGDFDLFINLSLKYPFYVIQKPLAYYRSHNNNISKIKKLEYVFELKRWLKNNSKKLRKKNLSLRYPLLTLKKLQLKNFFNL